VKEKQKEFNVKNGEGRGNSLPAQA